MRAERRRGATATVDGASSAAGGKLVEKSTNTNTGDAGKGKRDGVGGAGGDEIAKPAEKSTHGREATKSCESTWTFPGDGIPQQSDRRAVNGRPACAYDDCTRVSQGRKANFMCSRHFNSITGGKMITADDPHGREATKSCESTWTFPGDGIPQQSDRRAVNGRPACAYDDCTRVSQGRKANFMCARHFNSITGGKMITAGDPKANAVSADKGERGDVGGTGGDENTKPAAKKKEVVQEDEEVQDEDGDEEVQQEEVQEEEPATTPYDVSIVVQCKETRSRQKLTLPSDSTIGFVKRDYIKARGHALSLELFDSLVFFYNGYPVTDGLVIGVIATPGMTLELHIRF